MFFLLYSTNWPNFIAWFSFLRFWTICVLQFCFPGRHVINLEINLIFLIRSFFYMTKTWCLKIRIKELLRRKTKHFSSPLMGFHLPKIVLDLGYGCSFVAKLSWVECFVQSNLQIICRKKTFIWKKSFILKNFLLKIFFFFREKFKWKCEKLYI